MTRLIWGESSDRVYEGGADKGVLYLPGDEGVPWNGLVSVTERPTGGEPTPYYLDGIKFANFSAAEEFEFSIEAFTAPVEFAVCDGIGVLNRGLFATQQKRKSFGFAYRTLIGDGNNELGMGYKLHLVYNALAGPSEKSSSTLSDSPEPTVMSWDVTSKPEKIFGVKPTAHLVIDSTKANKAVLGYLESYLYGTKDRTPILLPPADIVTIFDWSPLELESAVTVIGDLPSSSREIVNLATNPSFETASGTVEIRRNLFTDPRGTTISSSWATTSGGAGASALTAITGVSNGPHGITTAMRATVSAVGTWVDIYNRSAVVTPGVVYSFSAWARSSRSGGPINKFVQWLNSSGGTISTNSAADSQTFVNGVWIQINFENLTAPEGAVTARFIVRFASETIVGQILDVTAVMAEASSTYQTYFDGSSQPKLRRNYAPNPRMIEGGTGAASHVFTAQGGHVSYVTDITIPGTDITTGRRIDWEDAPVGSPANFTAGGTGVNAIPVSGGTTYMLSVFGFTSFLPTNGCRIDLTQYDSSGVNLGSSNGPPVPPVIGEWQRFSSLITTNPNTAYIRIAMVFSGPELNGAGGYVMVSGYMIEPTSELLEYFDGTSQLENGLSTTWEGSANASRSYVYDGDFTPTWTGTANASPSSLTAATVSNVAAPSTSQTGSHQTKHSVFVGDSAVRYRLRTTSAIGLPVINFLPTPGKTYTLLMRVRPMTRNLLATPRIHNVNGEAMTFPLGEWTESRVTLTAEGTSSVQQTGLLLYGGNGHQVDDIVDIDAVLLVEGEYDGPYFDGASASVLYNNQLVIPSWNGTAHASTSKITIQDSLPDTATNGTAYLINGEMWVYEGAWRNLGSVPTIE